MSPTARHSEWIEILFVALAVLGLVGTWAQAFGYLEAGLLAGNVRFWTDAFSSPAGTFLSVDVLVLAAALFVWIFGEGRRLGMAPGWLWACFLGSLLVGISFAVPLFLAYRQRRIRRQRLPGGGQPRAGDWIAIVVAVLIAVAAVARSLAEAS